MDDIDSYITRINAILNEDTNLEVAQKQGKKSNFRRVHYKNITTEQLESICKRSVALYETGVYYPPEKSYVCKNKNKKKTKSAPKINEETENKKLNTRFGQGRIGVSCSSYGVKNCSCCGPNNNIPLYSYYESDVYPYLEEPQSLVPSAIIDLTDVVPSTSKVSKNWNNSIITIPDSDADNSEITSPDIIDYIDLVNDEFEKEQTIIKEIETLLQAEIDQDLTLNTNPEIQIKKELNTEMEDVKPNISNGNIMDFIESLTKDFDPEAVRKYDPEFESMILNEIESESLSSASTAANSIPELPTQHNVSLNENSETRLNLSNYLQNKIRKNLEIDNHNQLNVNSEPITSNTLRNIEVPKTINVNNSAQIVSPSLKTKLQKENIEISSARGLNIECPICLDSLKGQEIMSTICGHVFCATCIIKAIKKTKRCPNCRKVLSLKSIHPIYVG